jgi:integrase
MEVARGSSDQTCPAHVLTQWLHYAKIDFGPLFVAVSLNRLKATSERLSDKHVARLIKACAGYAVLRPGLPEAERIRFFSSHSLRAGLASSAEVDERYVQKQLGHASAEMTRDISAAGTGSASISPRQLGCGQTSMSRPSGSDGHAGSG